jgi:hypothetical protein
MTKMLVLSGKYGIGYYAFVGRWSKPVLVGVDAAVADKVSGSLLV